VLLHPQQEPFYPERMANRILGMGDVLSFVEKAQDVVEVRPRLSLSLTPGALISLHLCTHSRRLSRKAIGAMPHWYLPRLPSQIS
jgi:hypothetical protein